MKGDEVVICGLKTQKEEQKRTVEEDIFISMQKIRAIKQTNGTKNIS
jgi:hypothetical protein